MNPYEILGVASDATEKEIKSAYRKKAMECHPDKHPDDPEALGKFHKLNDAYETLTNPRRNQQNTSDNFDFHDIFNAFNFGHAQRRPMNSNIQAMATITLAQAYTGMEISITTPSDRIITVEVPAGVYDGQNFRVAGEGGKQYTDIPPGDLILIVRVVSDHVWGRQGDDLVTAIPLDYIDIMLGKEIEIKTILGQTLKVSIPEGGTRVRLAGKGMPIQKSGGQFGDLYLMIQPTLPDLDAKEMARLKKVRKPAKA